MSKSVYYNYVFLVTVFHGYFLSLVFLLLLPPFLLCLNF